MLKALTALCLAATAYLERWRIWKEYQITKEIFKLDDEIIDTADSDDASSVLRVEQLNSRREQLRALRSSFRDTL